MKHAASIFVLASTALAVAACNSGGGGASTGGMYVLSCTLGCTNGIGGKQVSCGLVNTYQNQDIAVLFSEEVDASSVSNNSFQIFDVATGTVPQGTFDVDDSNPRRLIFRPKLAFDVAGNPIFGFAQGATYQIKIPGTAAGDTPPFVMSTGGKANTSRMLCTITTDQGLVDAVPGDPRVTIRVTVVDPVTQDPTVVVVPDAGAPLTNVARDSNIEFEFNDLMNVGTLIVAGGASSPFITIKVDPDGDLSNTSDQVTVGGTYSFTIDQSTLTTTLLFDPSGEFPSAGSDPLAPRTIVVDVPSAVRDLVGNGVDNSGRRTFIPVVVPPQPVELPPGGEQFLDQQNLDPTNTGAYWGEIQLGRLQPGIGGGSGRLGNLELDAGVSMTLNTSPRPAQGRILFTVNPKGTDNAFIEFNLSGFAVLFKVNISDPLTQTKIESFLSDTLSEAATYLNANPAADPEVARCRFWVESYNTLVCEYLQTGAAGNNFVLYAGPNYVMDVVGGFDVGLDSQGNLSGGLDYVEFTNTKELLTNTPAGGTVAPIQVSDGVFEFSRVVLGANSVLRFVGDNPARLFARGLMQIADTAEIQVVGETSGVHNSEGPHGQIGGIGGPAAGDGGSGAYRPDNTGSSLMSLPATPAFKRGVTNRIGGAPVPNHGFDGEGVGGVAGLGQGQGGSDWPTVFPTETTVFGGMDTSNTCNSQQVGAPGSGGAYSLDGYPSAPAAVAPTGALGTSNAPAATPGGDSSTIGLGPTNPPGPARRLDPELGFLRGGSGGGGGSATITGTGTTAAAPPCLTTIDEFYSHSGASGGGGGGAIQASAGRLVQLFGRIDASGGDGGRVATAALPGTPTVNNTGATPGGGGSGGGVLVQARTVDIAFVPNRIDIRGGLGGAGDSSAVGGEGGPGLVRVEDLTNLDPNVIDDSVSANAGPTPPSSDNWVTVGTFDVETSGPGALSGAQSCWMLPTGSYFSLVFDSDAGTTKGWDMDVFLDFGTGEIRRAFRSDPAFGGNTAEQHWGNTLGGSPVVVRFQGAKSIGAISNPCTVDPNDPFAPIQMGSLTPWVMHPDELNAFSPPPDMVRFQIVFDRSHADFGVLKGVTNVRIRATGD